MAIFGRRVRGDYFKKDLEQNRKGEDEACNERKDGNRQRPLTVVFVSHAVDLLVSLIISSLPSLPSMPIV